MGNEKEYNSQDYELVKYLCEAASHLQQCLLVSSDRFGQAQSPKQQAKFDKVRQDTLTELRNFMSLFGKYTYKASNMNLTLSDAINNFRIQSAQLMKSMEFNNGLNKWALVRLNKKLKEIEKFSAFTQSPINTQSDEFTPEM
ncbi:MAG: hypothetical protein ACI4PF_00660 [Christensenellales bacterium]